MAKLLKIYCVHTQGDDKRYGEPTDFFLNQLDAEIYAHGRGWYGSNAGVTSREALVCTIEGAERYFLISKEIDIDNKRKGAINKLAIEAKNKLSIAELEALKESIKDGSC